MVPVGASVLAVAALAAVAAPAQAVQHEELLRRMAAWVQTFVDNFTNVVAEEEYLQRFRQAAGRRVLKSDYLLVAYPGRDGLLLTFRDVVEVDGRPVQDQQERLARLFLEPFGDAIRRAAEIQREAARHSLDRGARLADPLQVIAYLQRDYHQNFAFTVRGLDKGLGADVRQIELAQTGGPRAVAPIRARAWVAESSGRVVKTELITGLGTASAFTTTTFGFDATLRIDVPLAMHDSVPRGVDDFLGDARYTRFRRFQVRAEQQVTLPSPQ